MFVQAGANFYLAANSEILKFNFSFVSEGTGDNGKFQEQFPSNNNNNNEGREMREKHDMKSANKPDGREGLTNLK